MDMHKGKKVSQDFLLNLLSALLVLGSTEFFVLPHLAAAMTPDEYGKLLLILGIITTLSSAAGNGLNNARLILHHKYKKNHLNGDYNLLVIGISVVLSLTGIAAGCFLHLGIYDIAMFVLISWLGFLRLYLSVFFRLQLNYQGILLLNGLLSGGYVLTLWGLTVENELFMHWYWIYFLAELIACSYLIKSTKFYTEPWERTSLFPVLCKSFGWLCYLTFLGSLLNYMDRNLLLPLLGGEAVALIFVAMMTGKTISFLAKPMANVMLSYFAQQDFVMTRKRYWMINLYTCIAGAGCYVVSVISAKWVLLYLYPAYAETAAKYIHIASAIPILVMLGALAQPAVLRYAPLRSLSVWQTSYVVAYLIVSYGMVEWQGLVGFCYGAIGLGMVRLVLLWWLGDWSIQKGAR